jgi:hypothetical protein
MGASAAGQYASGTTRNKFLTVNVSRLSTLSTRAIVTCPIVPIVLTQLLSCPLVTVLTHRVAIVLIPIVEPSIVSIVPCITIV